MKILKILNTIAILIPFIVALGWFYNENYLFYALFSTMAIGFIQVCVGLVFLIKFPKNSSIIIYLSTVLLYFILIYFDIESINFGNFILIGMPTILCIYLSIIIYSKKIK